MTALPCQPRSIAWAAVLGSVIGIGSEGCSRNSVPTTGAVSTLSTTDPTAERPEPNVSHATSTITLTPARQFVDDPAADGWQTETVSEAIDRRLKKLGEMITTRTEAAAWKKICADNFRTQPLRPTAPQLVYQEGAIAVYRHQADADDSTAAGDADVKGNAATLSRSLGHFRSEFGEPHGARWKFKIYDVQLEENQSATIEVYAQLFIRFAAAFVQTTSTWRTRWSNRDGDEYRIISLDVLNYEETIYRGHSAAFSDCTESVFGGAEFDQQLRMGVDHWLDKIEARTGIDIGGWQGLALGDVNGDDLDDVYVCQPGGLPNRLFVRNADGTTRETSAAAGVDWLDTSHGALLVDLDNDGDQDLLVGVDYGILVHSNDGRGRFEVRAALLLPAGLPYSITAADPDQDGDLDVYVCCYNRRQLGDREHVLFVRPIPYHDANNGSPNVFLRNDGTPRQGPWRFGYATSSVGLAENNHKFSYAAAWEDYDNDGDVDLYVANDFGRNNLYRNDRGKFTDVAAAAGVDDIGPGMSACWGDSNNDGRMDLYVSNMFSSAGNRITAQSRFHAQADGGTRSEFRRHSRGNSLFANQGDGTFRDVSVESGVVLGRWAWGSRFIDINNDGWQDLLVANGFITQDDTGDL